MTGPLHLDVPRFSGPALCAEIGGDDWFPEKGGNVQPVKAMCRRCSVRDECLAWALEHNEDFGVWGGLSARERARLKRAAA